jgi:hypothetical protein
VTFACLRRDVSVSSRLLLRQQENLRRNDTGKLAAVAFPWLCEMHSLLLSTERALRSELAVLSPDTLCRLYMYKLWYCLYTEASIGETRHRLVRRSWVDGTISRAWKTA